MSDPYLTSESGADPACTAGKRPRLTDTQREIVVLVARGLTRRQIARSRGVREETVADGLKRIAHKFRLGDRHALRQIRLHAYDLLAEAAA